MYIYDRYTLNQQFLAREIASKNIIESNKKREEDYIRITLEQDLKIKNKRLEIDKYDELKKNELIAMNKEADDQLYFAKKVLNII